MCPREQMEPGILLLVCVLRQTEVRSQEETFPINRVWWPFAYKRLTVPSREELSPKCSQEDATMPAIRDGFPGHRC